MNFYTLAVKTIAYKKVKQNSTMLETYSFYEKKPKDCTNEELERFYELVLKGKKVQKEGLRERIDNCEILGFCLDKENIIGISAIKKPQKSYRENIILKSQINRTWEELSFEIGYSFTENMYRKKGINREIKGRLLKSIEKSGGLIFSTTAIKSSQAFLIENGFKNAGQPYNGKNDNDLKYYERLM